MPVRLINRGGNVDVRASSENINLVAPTSGYGKQDKITAIGILKGEGDGVVTQAIPGEDYLDPSNITQASEMLVDTEVVLGSENLITSGAVASALRSFIDPYEVVNSIIDGSIRYFKTDAHGPLVNDRINLYESGRLRHIRFFSQRNAVGALGTTIWGADNVKYVNVGKVSSVRTQSFMDCPELRSIIIRSKSVAGVWPGEVALPTESTIVYVPDLDENGNSLPNLYRASVGWSDAADNIKGYSEAQAYSESTEYSIGDVCKYNGKFYGYCRKDLQPSIGNAPSGIRADNDYWEYVDNVGV